MTRAITTQALDQTAENQIAVGFEHHVNEVDDDDATDITQTQLTNDFFGSLKVVVRHGFFQRATGTNELTGVDVNDRHRFRTVNDERATRRQPDLAVHTLRQLLVNAVSSKHVIGAHPLFDAVRQFR
ncbi:Uncharacterised protein [Chlamydia trachomatis]|nr:Uncharacterised protein [Chlamydia trachomatis]